MRYMICTINFVQSPNIFRECFEQIKPPILVPPKKEDYDDTALLADYLFEIGHIPTKNIPVPLLEFITRLADKAENAQALRDWVKDAAQRIGLSPEQISRLGQTRRMEESDKHPLYLMISLSPKNPNKPGYTAQVWFVDEAEKHRCIAVKEKDFTLNRMPALLKESLAHPHVHLNTAVPAEILRRALVSAGLNEEATKISLMLWHVSFPG